MSEEHKEITSENKIKLYFHNLYKSYRGLKLKIPPEVGSKIYSIVLISLGVLFFVLIPVLFTTLTTLAGFGMISYLPYQICSYIVWSLMVVKLILLVFFHEFKK